MRWDVRERRFGLLERALEEHRAAGHRSLSMTVWAQRVDPELDPELHRHHPCGTAACALGTLALRPEARRLGLTLVATRWWFGPERPLNPRVLLGDDDFWQVRVRYRGLYGYDAAIEFLGISEEDAWYLFAPDSYDRADLVADGTPDEVRVGVVLKRVRRVRRRYLHERGNARREKLGG
jgi:hypothetical protein